jgi:hypothetical protein
MTTADQPLLRGDTDGQDDFHHLQRGLHAEWHDQPALRHVGRRQQQDHAAIHGAGGANTNWTITNSGHLNGTVTGLFGINLGYFGPTITSATIINSAGGVVAGQQYGIITDGPTTITNQSGGTLSANGNDIAFLQTRSTVFNYGLLTNAGATGLYLQGGGVVVNGPTGTISIDTAVSGIGVRLNAVGTVTNAGTIIGGTGGTGRVQGNHVRQPADHRSRREVRRRDQRRHRRDRAGRRQWQHWESG